MKIIKNKKAWVRIAEAFIAIILITGVLVVLYSGIIKTPEKSEEIYKFRKLILDEVADNSSLRYIILDYSGASGTLEQREEAVENFVFDRIPLTFDFDIRICEVEDICNLGWYEENVYSSERIISSTLEIYGPKKLKIFMWLGK